MYKIPVYIKLVDNTVLYIEMILVYNNNE
jgi:hypothetical protein